MKYLNKYLSWKKINEEISDDKVVDAANKAEDSNQPDRADELRMKIVPEVKDEFEFYFLPLSIKGDIVTFRAYVDNRADAVKVSRMVKVFNKLPGLPEVNKLWVEIGKIHKSKGLVTVNYSGNSKFMFIPSAGYFVSHKPKDYANPEEQSVTPIVLYYDYPFTHMMSGSKHLDYAHFSQSGPSQIIKINFDTKEGILKADIKIDLKDFQNKELIIAAGGTVEEEKPKQQTIENSDELIKAIEMYSERPGASIKKLSELRPELSDILNKEFTFILREPKNLSDPGPYKKFKDLISSVYGGLYDSKWHKVIRQVYVENEKDAKDINEVIKFFLKLKRIGQGYPHELGWIDDNYKEDTLLTEKKKGDIEVNGKFLLITDQYRRLYQNFPEIFNGVADDFFGFEFKLDQLSEEAKKSIVGSNSSFHPNYDTSYIILLPEFNGSQLFTIIPHM